MLACTRTGLPIAWQVETARHHESKFVAPLLDAAHRRGFRVHTVAMDKGYDVERVHAECETRGCSPIIPLKGAVAKQTILPVGPICRLNPRIPRHTERFCDLYAGRSAVEREFGRLKNDYGFAPLRVRGLARVQLHADLTILARLAQALLRAREATALPLAA
jgi:acetolactate synthase regulatory subunit